MFSIFSNSGDIRYGIKEYICDTADDIANLPKDDKPGSTAFIISTGSVYMLNSEGQWVEV